MWAVLLYLNTFLTNEICLYQTLFPLRYFYFYFIYFKQLHISGLIAWKTYRWNNTNKNKLRNVSILHCFATGTRKEHSVIILYEAIKCGQRKNTSFTNSSIYPLNDYLWLKWTTNWLIGPLTRHEPHVIWFITSCRGCRD